MPKHAGTIWVMSTILVANIFFGVVLGYGMVHYSMNRQGGFVNTVEFPSFVL